ncbi:bifunctional DNA primase/polymerase [Glaciihabitans sp. UYNi722]|uniref:bifunctional DNA primase/polymerase n=1 Tax=Glaciihabitans sp. UYNi722 TaxID=3156344 RepID=UPI0033983F61
MTVTKADLKHGPLRYLPLSRGTNRPAVREWQHRASSDPNDWDKWSHEIPGCNWGVLTGDGVGVLDLDTKNAPEGDAGGFGSLIDVEEVLDIDLSNLPLVQTASGAHLYFRYEGTLPSKLPWIPHLDVIADGGRQVAAPGSVREVNGAERVYTLLRGSLEDIPFAPEVLVQSIRQWRIAWSSGGGTRGGSMGHLEDLKPVSHYLDHGLGEPGERDNTCYRLACSLWRKHWNDPRLVEAIIADAWKATQQGSHQFTWREAKFKIDRAREFVQHQVDAENTLLRNFGGAP